MLRIGRGVSRDVQTKFVDATSKEFFEYILSQTIPVQIYRDPFLTLSCGGDGSVSGPDDDDDDDDDNDDDDYDDGDDDDDDDDDEVK